jgi:hypothetical protein
MAASALRLGSLKNLACSLSRRGTPKFPRESLSRCTKKACNARVEVPRMMQFVEAEFQVVGDAATPLILAAFLSGADGCTQDACRGAVEPDAEVHRRRLTFPGVVQPETVEVMGAERAERGQKLRRQRPAVSLIQHRIEHDLAMALLAKAHSDLDERQRFFEQLLSIYRVRGSFEGQALRRKT